MVEVNGRRLALRCSGSGTSLVILETGLGAESSEWAEVERGVRQFSRVCSYDRLGRGRSDPVTHPRSAEDMIKDLRSLLRAADLSGPFLFAGHSFGGLLARLFAQRYRDEVQGLILVDGMHQDQFERSVRCFPRRGPMSLPRFEACASSGRVAGAGLNRQSNT
jgi:pimeloyl-ACP methyl ester carboxylesterase